MTTAEDTERAERLALALESMLWQHAYRTVVGGVPHLASGGMSANEEAFEALGWPDPKPCAALRPERTETTTLGEHSRGRP